MTGTDDDGERRHEFEEAYRSLYEPICGYVIRRVTDPDDAADVIAETFLTLWRRWDDAPGGAARRPWLFGVARRVAANLRRGNHRRSALGDRLRAEFRAAPWPGPPAAAAGGPDDDPAAAAYATLSEPDRELLALVAWEGLSHEELAIALRTSRPVVRLRLHRARRRFAAAYDALTGAARDGVKRSGSTGHVTLRQATARPGGTRGES